MKHGSYMIWPVLGSKYGKDYTKNRFIAQEHLFYDHLTKRAWLSDKWLNIGAVTWQ
jgi:hypothetical protein